MQAEHSQGDNLVTWRTMKIRFRAREQVIEGLQGIPTKQGSRGEGRAWIGVKARHKAV